VSVDLPVGPAGRVPRHVWVLVVVVIVVLGFAVGGVVRAAVASGPGPTPVGRAPTGQSPRRVPTTPVPVPTVRASGVVSAAVLPTRPGLPLPDGSGSGARIVYRESSMHLWVVGSNGLVIRDYPVTGRPGWPAPGTYHVFSKSEATVSPRYGVTFAWMVRFAHGHDLDIGFHDIPRVIGTGIPIQTVRTLGAPIGHGGCVRQSTADARWLYGWAAVGTTVVVLR
jgi:L,D-transpeptidase catalytic domain